MIVQAWIASQSGLPSFHLDGVGPLMATDAWGSRVVTQTTGERLVSDAGAAGGAPTVYRHGSDEVTLVRPGGSWLLTDVDGRRVAGVRVTGVDERGYNPRVHLYDRPSAGDPLVRWSLAPAPPEGSVEFLSDRAGTLALRELVVARSLVWLIHDAQSCQIPDCDIEGSRLLVLTGSPRERRSARRDRADRSWQADYVHVTSREPAQAAPVVTWGEWQAWGIEHPTEAGWQAWSAVEVARRVAGMPVP